MSKYTTELRYLIETGFDIGLKEYPIFDEKYRDKLNQKIIDHYSFREIGFETAELFKRFLNRTMNEIMPLYNQWYKSTLLEFNPLITKLVNESYQRNGNTSTNYNDDKTDTIATNDTANSKNVFSDTPQGLLSIDSIMQSVYATNATLDENTNNSNTNGTSNTTGEQQSTSSNNENHTISGYEGNISELVLKYRETFTNIDMKIIEDLSDLFMNLY